VGLATVECVCLSVCLSTSGVLPNLGTLHIHLSARQDLPFSSNGYAARRLRQGCSKDFLFYVCTSKTSFTPSFTQSMSHTTSVFINFASNVSSDTYQIITNFLCKNPTLSPSIHIIYISPSSVVSSCFCCSSLQLTAI